MVGRGQLGLQAAGVQVKLGLPMTLLEAAVRILSQATSVHFRELHLANQHYLADATILARCASHSAKPWFWSSQNAAKLQIVGLSAGHHEVVQRAVDNGALSL